MRSIQNCSFADHPALAYLSPASNEFVWANRQVLAPYLENSTTSLFFEVAQKKLARVLRSGYDSTVPEGLDWGLIARPWKSQVREIKSCRNRPFFFAKKSQQTFLLGMKTLWKTRIFETADIQRVSEKFCSVGRMLKMAYFGTSCLTNAWTDSRSEWCCHSI